jgi:membrane protein involved in colicin uptake
MIMKHIILVYLVILLGLSCKTVQTSGTQHIDTVINSGILDSDKPLTKPQKQQIKATLGEAKQEIIQEKEAEEKAEKEAKENSRLAHQAKVFWGIIGVMVTACIGFTVFKIWKKFP